jgi:hypothetical protein
MMMFVCDRATDLVDGLSVDPEPSMRSPPIRLELESEG